MLKTVRIELPEDKIYQTESSRGLVELQKLFVAESTYNIKTEKQGPLPGQKDGGLTLAIAVTGLAFTGINTFLNVMMYFKGKNAEYKIVHRTPDGHIEISNLSRRDLELYLKNKGEISSEITLTIEPPEKLT
ncbi:MAG: hypothetical protein AAFR61_16090 [Bacteroidota bacterium]